MARDGRCAVADRCPQRFFALVFALAGSGRIWTDFMVAGDSGKAIRDCAGGSRDHQPWTLSINPASDVSG